MGRIALKYEVPGGSHNAAVPRAGVLIAPYFLLMNRIPSEQKSLLTFKGVLQ